MSKPIRGCSRISSASASLRGPGLRSTLSSTPILPMSCSSAARRSASRSFAGIRMASAISRLTAATRAEWPDVVGSRASMARASASMLANVVSSSAAVFSSRLAVISLKVRARYPISSWETTVARWCKSPAETARIDRTSNSIGRVNREAVTVPTSKVSKAAAVKTRVKMRRCCATRLSSESASAAMAKNPN